MKNLVAIFIIVISISIFFACNEPPVVFKEAQPQGYLNDTYITPIYQGTFLCESDSSIVHIKNRTIHKEKKFAIETTFKEIEELEEAEIRGDSLYVIDENVSIPIEVKGDSIFSSFTMRDTLFKYGAKQKIRLYKGHLVVSIELRPNNWEVFILSLDNGLNLVFSEAAYPADLERLSKITPVEDQSTKDKIQFRVSPTIIEFDKIFDEKLIFDACDLFTRIHNPVFI